MFCENLNFNKLEYVCYDYSVVVNYSNFKLIQNKVLQFYKRDIFYIKGK